MRSLAHFIKEALAGFRQHFSTVLGAIVTIYLSLLVIGIFLVATMIIDQLVASVENQVAISIWVNDNATPEDITAMQDYIRTLPGVADVTFKTKDQALEEFKETASPDIIAALGDNPLPASIEVSLSDPEQVQTIVSQIMASDPFLRVIDSPDNPSQSVRYGQDIVNRLFTLTRLIRYVSLGLVALLVFVALIFINNTIRLAIYARRKEISIMRLVGASKSFIRGPFLTESILQSLIGAGLAVATIHFGMSYLASSITLNIPWLMVNFARIPVSTIYLGLLGVGLLIGLFGSFLAMRRYLKV